ncbi:hypothetical protein C0993_002679 [Termitomyces sp. T159_Od127]|nr:hypothetical protein C0993_002679 [Termitomyces sp. T159_Od127]
MHSNQNPSSRYPLRTRNSAAQSAGQGTRTGTTNRDAGPPGLQARTAQGNGLGTRGLQDMGSTGYDTQPSPELKEPGDPLEGDKTDAPSAQAVGGTDSSRSSSELAKLPSTDSGSTQPQDADVTTPRRRAWVENGSSEGAESRELSEEQTRAVDSARDTLTERDRERIDRRYANITVTAINNAADDGEETHQEGTSQRKGKGIDPRNWGAAQLSGDEIDPEIQQQILDECYRQQADAEDRETGEPGQRAEDQLDQSGWENQEYPDQETGPDEAGEDESAENRRTKRMTDALLKASRKIEKKERARAAKKGHQYMTPKGYELNARGLMEQMQANLQGDPESSADEGSECPAPKRRKAKMKSRNKKKREERTKAMKPMAQIAGESALGHAFRRIRAMNSDSPSDSSSSTSSEESSSEPSDGSDSEGSSSGNSSSWSRGN